MPLGGKRKAKKPVPKAMTAVQIAANEVTALLLDWRAHGRIGVKNLKASGVLGKLLGGNVSFDVELPPRR